ncbi:hypothetical protein ACT29H_06830 [Thermophagus sp. OGC60D27]|uniref:hypothetical protein n=1 Tax=Thermophagus sp. OGC60D27 TaxID=3458415 RepID=UPI004037ECBA
MGNSWFYFLISGNRFKHGSQRDVIALNFIQLLDALMETHCADLPFTEKPEVRSQKLEARSQRIDISGNKLK